MDEQIREANELNEKREMIIEEEMEETEENVEIQETNSVDVPCSLKEEGYKELVDAVFEHAKDTMKEKDKIDWFVLGCGLFAIVCLGISVVNVIRYGIDILFGVMMAAYVIVAVFCLVKKLQYKAGRAFWTATFKGKTKAGKKEAVEMRFTEDGITYSNGKKDITHLYDSFWDAYETEEYYVFHVTDHCIIPISKTDVNAAQEDYEGIELRAYFAEICEKYKRVENEEAEGIEEAKEVVDEAVEEREAIENGDIDEADETEVADEAVEVKEIVESEEEIKDEADDDK